MASSVLFAALGLTSVATVAPAGAAQAPASTSTCGTAATVVWLDTSGNGAAGSVYYTLEFTNLGAAACTLAGYPGVSAVGVSGRQIGGAATRDLQHAARVVRLGPGATAVATLRIVEAGNFPAARCHESAAAGLRVYPPGSTTARLVPFPFAACALAASPILSVGVVEPGSTAS